jgi:hypothetical protein
VVSPTLLVLTLLNQDTFDVLNRAHRITTREVLPQGIILLRAVKAWVQKQSLHKLGVSMLLHEAGCRLLDQDTVRRHLNDS